MYSIVEEFQALPDEERDMEGAMMVTCRYFDGHANRRELRRSAFYRLEALARLITTGKLKGWAEQASPKEPAKIHKALLAAAGEAPASFSKGDMSFQRKALLQSAFRIAAQMKHP